MKRIPAGIAAGVLALATAGLLAAEPATPAPPNPQVPRTHEFPSAAAGEYLAGELVMSDPINRRGSLRLDADLSFHARRERNYWLPGWVDHVDHQENIVTVTLFGGRDRSLFDAVRAMGQPGRIVRVAPNSFGNPWPPPEWRARSLDE
jgi:hypothetical protein